MEITEAFLAKVAGWETVKMARALLAAGRVISSGWAPPILRGVVQEGSNSLRSGLVIKDTINIENMCSCRPSQQWGTLCAHSIAVGLHWIQRQNPTASNSATHAAATSRSSSTSSSNSPSTAGAGSVPTSRPSPSPTPLSRAPSRWNWVQEKADIPAERAQIQVKVILPPNLLQALDKGRTMVCLEVTHEGRTTPLDALKSGRTYRVQSCDLKLLERVQDFAAGELASMLQLDPHQLGTLLTALQGHPRVTLGRNTSLEIRSQPLTVPLTARLGEKGEIDLWMPALKTRLPKVLPPWNYEAGTFSPIQIPAALAQSERGLAHIPRSEVPLFLSRDWPALVEAGARAENFDPKDFKVETVAPRLHLQLGGGLAQLTATLQAQYGSRFLTPGSKSAEPWFPDPDDIRRYQLRDTTAEQSAVSTLARAGFQGPDDQGRWKLVGQEPVIQFFARLYPRLQREWSVVLEERLDQSCAKNFERVEPEFKVLSSGIQWLDFSVNYRVSSGDTLSAAEVQRLLRSGQNHARLQNGKIALFNSEALDEFNEVLHDCQPQQDGQKYRIAASQAAYLGDTLENRGWKVESAPQTDWQKIIRQQSGRTLGECPDVGTLNSVLRPYQKQGVAWLQFLRAHEFGGILADEMGLGKTLQVLAHLRAVHSGKAAHRAKGPFLVVCPTSLVYNWEAEAGRFTPELKLNVISGHKRQSRLGQIQESDLVITSYALLRRDAEHYRQATFDTVILDEAQHIKNRQTQNAQAVKRIRADHRLVLTGTPMENSVLDLWSIFDFLMPGYLGSDKDFRERYELPIVKSKDQAAAQRLARRLKPFLIRRLKKDVIQDLPSKMEQISYCEMGDEQRALYDQILEAGRREMLEASTAGAQQQGRSRMLVLTTLLRLRQACCDPRLLGLNRGATPAEADSSVPDSGKLEMFDELLDEILDGGHRALVFSQFTQMLQLLASHLESRKVEYCYLDGSTRDRGAVVKDFQEGVKPVFLISLKAGGVGLNLTAADTVIHFDPWWNPAVEDQATDRAHRLGQKRVVTSFKLIARGSVEEKIVELQRRKRELTAAMLEGEEAFTEALTWEEIQGLLS